MAQKAARQRSSSLSSCCKHRRSFKEATLAEVRKLVADPADAQQTLGYRYRKAARPGRPDVL